VDLPRLLVPVTYGFSVRYVDSTGLIDQLRELCTPVLALSWDDRELRDHLERRGAEVRRLPSPRLTHDYRMYRRRLELVHQRRLRSPTAPILQHRSLQAYPFPRARTIARLRRGLDVAALAIPGAVGRLESREEGAITEGTNVGEFAAFLEEADVEAVLSVTPYHDEDALLLVAARRRGLPTLASIISFDNPTTRGRLVVPGDRVLVWNGYNADELVRSYPALRPHQIGLIGAPQFDIHLDERLVLTADEWRRRLGIPERRPVVLYGAGPSSLVPRERELVVAIDRALGDRAIDDRPFLLVRRHPADEAELWQELNDRLRDGMVVHPWEAGPRASLGWPRRSDLEMLVSTLAHSAVHISVCSSMSIDGALADRPQISPRFAPGATRSERRTIEEFYRQEHWRPLGTSGGVAVVDDMGQLIRELETGLKDPSARASGRRELLRRVLTWPDGRATSRLVEEVDRFLQLTSRS
jgi:hypothetical protein